MKMRLKCLWRKIRFLTTGALEDLIARKKCITHLIVIWLETFMTRTPTREIMFTEVRNISNMTVSKVPYRIDTQYLQKLDYILLLIRNVQPPSINFMTFLYGSLFSCCSNIDVRSKPSSSSFNDS